MHDPISGGEIGGRGLQGAEGNSAAPLARGLVERDQLGRGAGKGMERTLSERELTNHKCDNLQTNRS
jgi:hypothetical protein